MAEGTWSIATQNAARQSASSLNSSAEEVGTAGRLDAIIQRSLTRHDEAVVDARGIGGIGLEGNEGREDIPRAADAESGRVGGWFQEQEDKIGIFVGGDVRNKSLG